jgi:glycosyltransferase involved in cell wall biosynthesis
MRRVAAGIVANLPILNASSRRWRDVIANDLERDERRSVRIENVIRRALDRSAGIASGDGVVMAIPSLAKGGAERQLVGLARLLARVVPVRVLVKHWGHPRFEHFRPDLEAAGVLVAPIRLEEYDLSAPNADLVPPMDPNLYALTRAFVESFRRAPPIAVHGWMDELGTAAALAGVLCGVPRTLIDTRSLRPTWFETRGVESIRSALRVLLERDGTFLVNNSRAGADDYKSWLQTDADVHVVQNGFDEAQWGACSSARRVMTPVIGGIMRLSAAKRPDRWINAAREYLAIEPSAEFRLWGGGPLSKQVRQRLRREGLHERIVWKGETDDVAGSLNEIDCLLMTSEVEGTPNVAIEAQWLGIPVVALAVGGLAEAIAPQLRHLLVDSESDLPSALSKAVQIDRDFVRNAAQKFIRSTFDPGRQLGQYLALYDRTGSPNH